MLVEWGGVSGNNQGGASVVHLLSADSGMALVPNLGPFSKSYMAH